MTVLHVDMDAFFASVEQRDHPEWRGRPVIVGSDPHARGVVSTCSYEARAFGVHSAMPSRTAFQHCPQGIFVRPRMDAYAETSERAFAVFAHYTPFVEAVSIDEAFLDVTGSAHLFGGPERLASALRAEIFRTCGVTCSAGLGPNRLLAKIASEVNKPNGFFAMPFDPEGIRAFLAPRPIGILWGVGKKTGEILAGYGYRTCGDIQSADPRFLAQVLGESAALSIRAHAFGEDDSPVAAEAAEEKSVSREYTFAEDEGDREAVRKTLLELVADVGFSFRSSRRWARTAKLKIRNAVFETSTRQIRFDLPACDDISFREKALVLFDATWPPGHPRIVRLIGFGVTDIVDEPCDPPPSLFGPDPRVAQRIKRERLAEAVDAIRRNTGNADAIS